MTTEQWVKDHESSFTGTDRLKPAEQVKHMTKEELIEVIINRRSGMVTLARKRLDELRSKRLHADPARGHKAYTDNTCACVLYDASDADREMGFA